MANIHILIIEDEPLEATLLKEQLESQGYSISGIATNLSEAKALYQSVEADIIIIDIFLNGNPDGIAFAQHIQTTLTRPKPFVFLTSATDKHTFEVARLTNPYSYLLKPFNPLELQYAIELAVEKAADNLGVFSQEQQLAAFFEDHFFIKKRNSLFKVMFPNITHIGVEGKYATIHSPEGQFLVQLSLKQLLEKLPTKQFIRIHRNTIVNYQKIKQLHLMDNLVVLEDDSHHNISRRYKEDFIAVINIVK